MELPTAPDRGQGGRGHRRRLQRRPQTQRGRTGCGAPVHGSRPRLQPACRRHQHGLGRSGCRRTAGDSSRCRSRQLHGFDGRRPKDHGQRGAGSEAGHSRAGRKVGRGPARGRRSRCRGACCRAPRDGELWPGVRESVAADRAGTSHPGGHRAHSRGDRWLALGRSTRGCHAPGPGRNPGSTAAGAAHDRARTRAGRRTAGRRGAAAGRIRAGLVCAARCLAASVRRWRSRRRRCSARSWR